MPKYTALSYTWGPEEPMSTMLIDGNTIDIRQNLGEALYYLTQRLQSGRGVARTQYFWADAVCINQDNTEERRAQVQLMRQIYEHAQNVVVWLGKPRYPDHADHFFQLAGQLDRVAQEALKRAFPYRPWWMPAPPPANDKDIMYQLLGPLRANSGVWGSRGSTQYAAWQSFFFDFLKSPWWSRTWVYQEATIPEDLRQFGMPGIGFLKNESKVKFVFGESVISWVPLLNAVDVGLRLLNDALVLQELRQNFSAPGNQPIDYAKNTIALFANLQHLKRLRKDQSSFDLLEILQIFRPTSCQDPRDKIYAPLGLAEASFRHRILPNYSDSNSNLKTYLEVVEVQTRIPGHELDYS